MNNPNTKQVGGTHYMATYQHWDYVAQTGMGYFEGQVTKYVLRWRQKNGKMDLQKAGHFVEKMITLCARPGGFQRVGVYSPSMLDRMITSYPHPTLFFERSILQLLSLWMTVDELQQALAQINTLIEADNMSPENTDAPQA